MNKIILMLMMLVFIPIAHAGEVVEDVDPNQLIRGEIKRDSLTSEQMSEIKFLHETFAEVDPSSLDQWVDDFKRDTHPDEELALWKHMADVYAHAINEKEATLAYKEEVFGLLVACSTMLRENVLKRTELHILSKEEAARIMDDFYGP